MKLKPTSAAVSDCPPTFSADLLEKHVTDTLSQQGQTRVGISNLAAVFPASSSSTPPTDGLVNQHEQCLHPGEAASSKSYAAEVRAAPPQAAETYQ